MKGGGVSLKGAYRHINQDCYHVRCEVEGALLVLSDGLGSRSSAHVGARALCRATEETVVARGYTDCVGRGFLEELHGRWLDILRMEGRSIEACAATALLAIVSGHVVQAFRLGDGFLAIASDAGGVVLFDDKDEGFVNVTDSLQARFDYDLWECRTLPFTRLYGIVGCSDGVDFALSPENLLAMARAFHAEYEGMEPSRIEDDVRVWLGEMPGTDDKTLAFLLEELDCR